MPNLIVPLTNLAVKGKVKIEEEKSESFFGIGKKYILRFKSPSVSDQDLPPEELTILNGFRELGDRVKIDSSTPLISYLSGETYKTLEWQQDRLGYFPKHKYRWAEAINTLVLYVPACFIFLLIFASFLNPNILKSMVVLIGEFLISSPSKYLVEMTIFVASIVIFIYLLKSPNLEGRKMLDRISGFRNYIAEDFLRRSDISSEDIERYFPYAIALGIQEEWITLKGRSWEPNWYSPKQGTDSLTAYAVLTALSTDFARAIRFSGGGSSGGAGGAGAAGGSGAGGGGAGGGGGGGGA